MAEWTRGVTVRAEPEHVWPWLAQMGYGRAGWYTPTWIDRVVEPMLFQQHVPSPRSADRLLPEHQTLAVGCAPSVTEPRTFGGSRRPGALGEIAAETEWPRDGHGHARSEPIIP